MSGNAVPLTDRQRIEVLEKELAALRLANWSNEEGVPFLRTENRFALVHDLMVVSGSPMTAPDANHVHGAIWSLLPRSYKPGEVRQRVQAFYSRDEATGETRMIWHGLDPSIENAEHPANPEERAWLVTTLKPDGFPRKGELKVGRTSMIHRDGEFPEVIVKGVRYRVKLEAI